MTIDVSRPTQVTTETDEMRFNTGISAMMEFVNSATKWGGAPKALLEPFTLLLSPYAPHIAEEFWATLGHSESLAGEPWPAVRPGSQLPAKAVEIPFPEYAGAIGARCCFTRRLRLQTSRCAR